MYWNAHEIHFPGFQNLRGALREVPDVCTYSCAGLPSRQHRTRHLDFRGARNCVGDFPAVRSSVFQLNLLPASLSSFPRSRLPGFRAHISGRSPSSPRSAFPHRFRGPGTKDENGAGERNLVRLSVKFNASLYPADLRIGFNVIVPPRSVRAARQQHNDGGSSQGFFICLLHPRLDRPPGWVAPAHLPAPILC